MGRCVQLCASADARRSMVLNSCSFLYADSRETRVTDWRSFSKGGSKKAKRPKVLG